VGISSYPDKVSIAEGSGNVNFYGPALDAFGRVRISQPYTLFDSHNRYESDPHFDTSTSTGGSITHLPNESTVRMDVTTASGSEVVRQTYRSFPYQPGKSLLILTTFVMNTAKTGLRQRVGYFSTQNGIYLQQNDSTVSFVLRSYTSGSVDNSREVTQANWNGDKLDGTGKSGYTIDLTKSQILFIDIEWLGVGSVRCGFVIEGKFIVAHTFHNANIYSAVYMTTATLPVRYEITNTSVTASSSSLKQICSTVMSEGGYEQVAADSVIRRTTSLGSITTTFLPLISIRLASDTLGAIVLPNRVSVIPTTSDVFEVALIKNATLTGASYNTTDFAHVDYDITATALSGGTVVQSDFVASTNQSSGNLSAPTGYNFDLQLGVSIAGTSDVYTLAVRTMSGSGGSVYGSMSFYDLA
jgi:hypothetical protein